MKLTKIIIFMQSLDKKYIYLTPRYELLEI